MGAVQGGTCAEMGQRHHPWIWLGTRHSRLAGKRQGGKQALTSREVGTAQSEDGFYPLDAVA